MESKSSGAVPSRASRVLEMDQSETSGDVAAPECSGSGSAAMGLRNYPRFLPSELAANSNHFNHEYSGSMWSLDQNMNWTSHPSPKRCPSKENDAYKRYSQYLPPTSPKRSSLQEFVIGFGFLFGRQRTRLVRFPEEVVQKAESDQRFGETMGKLREVKRSTKHRKKLSALLTGSGQSEFNGDPEKPDLNIYRVKLADLPYPPDWDSWLLADNTNCPCSCLSSLRGNKKSTSSFSPAEEGRLPPAEYSDKFKVTEQKFCRSLDIIEEFVVGNLKTIDYTLGVIGLLPLGRSAQAQEGRFNHIAAGIWFFTFAIQELFQNQPDVPTKSELNELMVEFCGLAVFIDRVAHRTLLFAQLHSAFGDAALTPLKSAMNRLHVKSDVASNFQVASPLKLGQGLQLKSPPQGPPAASNNFKVVTRPWFSQPKPHGQNPWLPFAQQSKSFQLGYLKEFLSKLQHRMITLNGQMRFLTDDMFEQQLRPKRGKARRNSVVKKAKEQTFLSALESLDVVMYRFSVYDETTPSYERALLETVESVASDTLDLITKGETIIRSVVEIRDTVELGVTFMREVYEIDFAELTPDDSEFYWKGRGVACGRFWRKVCCLCTDDTEASPGFSAQDFFLTPFPAQLQKQSMMNSMTGFEFALQRSKEEVPKVGSLRCRPEGPALLHQALTSSTSLTLGPALGSGGVWDDLSNLDLTQLKDHVAESPLDLTDIRPQIAAEVKRREDLKREVNKFYSQGKSAPDK